MTLRQLARSDADELYELIDANRAHLSPWLPWAAGQTFDDTVDFLRRAEEQAARKDGFQAALIVEGRIAGVAGYRSVDWERRTTSIGYWLAEDRQGNGTMTAAVRELVDTALVTWRLERVEIQAAVENLRSRAIPERLGFCLEGIRPRAERVGDRELDHAAYVMDAARWRESRGGSC